MNKKLLTVAIGAALAAPMIAAQADVKVYGRLQAEEGHVSVERGSAYNGVAANEDLWILNDTGLGRLGVDASEDLGGGFKAIGKIEWQVDTADGYATDNNLGTATGTATTGVQANPFNAREIFVGVSQKDIGTLKFGRHNSPYLNAGVALDPFVTTMLEARGNLGMSGGKDVLQGHNSFLSNGVVFNSATWGGFSFQIYRGLDQSGSEATSAGTQGSNSDGDTSVNVRWSGGPVTVFGSYDSQDVEKTATQDTATAMQAGVQLKFGGTGINLMYEMNDNGDGTVGAASEKTWIFAGVNQKVGPVTIVAQGALYTTNGSVSAEREGVYYTVGAIYSMSKTSRVFAGYRHTEQHNPLQAINTQDVRVTSIGLRKDF